MSAAAASDITMAIAPQWADIRDGVAKVCEAFPNEYWVKLDHAAEYPGEFVKALTDAGYAVDTAMDGEEGFFLAGRKLGKLYQFFLNFGNATDANGAVSTASLVYQKGASGVWLSLQTLFMNPYYWFMNPWFRRVRLITVADLFEDRFGSRALARFYAVFQIFATVIVIIGFGNLVGYKVTASLLVKPEVRWTAEERASVEGYR